MTQEVTPSMIVTTMLYRGDISVVDAIHLHDKTFKEIIDHMKHNTPTSSNVESMDYDPRAEELIVHFRSGASYKYYHFPEDKWEEVKSAPSTGKYVNEQIKGKYESVRV